MDSRRKFLGSVATGLAGTLASPSALGANDRIDVGLIGAGARGMELAREAIGCPNVRVVACADVYRRRLEEAGALAPGVKTYLDYRELLEDKAVDAVLIATPQHLHAEHFVASLEAGKHVYVERTMAFSVEHARRMRAARQRAPKLAVQVGHQSCSSGLMQDALAMLGAGRMGKITMIQAQMFRNTPHGKPQWSRPVYPDMTPENILWDAFLGEAPKCAFDAHRYVNWRFFWDYSGGNFFENMSHQLAFWYRALGLQIPKTVTATGGLYVWKDGREVPDTMSVAMEHSEEMLFAWTSGFGNNQLGSAEHVLGTEGSILKSQQIRWIPQKVNRPKDAEVVGTSRTEPRAHMQNFFDSIRTGKEPNCPFELGFRVSIAARMSADSYRLQRPLRWDPDREEIV